MGRLRYQLENEGLDYIFSNDRLSLENIEINAPIGNNNHALITFEMVTSETLPWKESTQCFHYARTDYQVLNEYLTQATWSSDWENLSTDKHWYTVRSIINEATLLFLQSETLPEEWKWEIVSQNLQGRVQEKTHLL